MPNESQGHLLQNICEASSGICGHSLGSLHHRQHQKGRSCPTESSQICDRRLSAMTESLSWETLQHRRQQVKAIMMFRIVHAMVAIPASPHLQLLGAATRGHQYKYRVPYCRTNTYRIPSSCQVSDCGTSCQRNWQTLNPLTPSRQGSQPPHSPRLQDVCFFISDPILGQSFYPVFSLLLISLGPLAMCI